MKSTTTNHSDIVIKIDTPAPVRKPLLRSDVGTIAHLCSSVQIVISNIIQSDRNSYLTEKMEAHPMLEIDCIGHEQD